MFFFSLSSVTKHLKLYFEFFISIFLTFGRLKHFCLLIWFYSYEKSIYITKWLLMAKLKKRIFFKYIRFHLHRIYFLIRLYYQIVKIFSQEKHKKGNLKYTTKILNSLLKTKLWPMYTQITYVEYILDR